MDDLIPRDLYIGFDSYNNPGFVVEQINKWSKKDTAQIRQNIFKFMQTFHSSKVRMDNTIKLINGEQNSVKAFISEN